MHIQTGPKGGRIVFIEIANHHGYTSRLDSSQEDMTVRNVPSDHKTKFGIGKVSQPLFLLQIVAHTGLWNRLLDTRVHWRSSIYCRIVHEFRFPTVIIHEQ
jgi:hypothetical protein